MNDEIRSANLFWEGIVHAVESFNLLGDRYFERAALRMFDCVIFIKRERSSIVLKRVIDGDWCEEEVPNLSDILERMEESYVNGRKVLYCVEGLPSTWEGEDINFVFDIIDMVQRVAQIGSPTTERIKLVISN